MWKLNETQKEKVVFLYKDGISCPKIGDLFGVSDTAIRGILKRREIKLRSNRDSHRKISLDEKCFDKINEESAYWVGFLMADGCITKRGEDSFTITIRLHKKDLSHLVKFKHFLKTDAKIINTKDNGVQLAIKSTGLAKRLSEYNVTPRKSHSAKAPPELESNVAFWRGVIDGDGSLGLYWINSANKHVPQFRLVGSRFLLEQFKIFIIRNGIPSRAKVRPHKTIYEYALCGKFAPLAIELIYNNASIFLDRKYDLARNISVLSWAVVNQPNGSTTDARPSYMGQVQAPTL